jgi:hypothetical protein
MDPSTLEDEYQDEITSRRSVISRAVNLVFDGITAVRVAKSWWRRGPGSRRYGLSNVVVGLLYLETELLQTQLLGVHSGVKARDGWREVVLAGKAFIDTADEDRAARKQLLAMSREEVTDALMSFTTPKSRDLAGVLGAIVAQERGAEDVGFLEMVAGGKALAELRAIDPELAVAGPGILAIYKKRVEQGQEDTSDAVASIRRVLECALGE